MTIASDSARLNAPLPFEQLIGQGRAALESEDFALALEIFHEAQLRNPLSAEAMLGLSVAYQSESNLILALFWREALGELALEDALRRENESVSRDLEARIESKIHEMLALARESLDALPAELEDERRTGYGSLALLYGVADDFKRALEAKQTSIYRDAPDDTLRRYAGESAVMTHNYARAKTFLGEMAEVSQQDKLRRSLLQAQTARGEYVRAYETAGQITDAGLRQASVKAAVTALLRNLELTRAAHWIDLLEDGEEKNKLYDRLVEGYLKTGAFAQARALARHFAAEVPGYRTDDFNLMTSFALLNSEEVFESRLLEALTGAGQREQMQRLYRAALNASRMGNEALAGKYCGMLQERARGDYAFYADFGCAAIAKDAQAFLNAVRKYPYEISGLFLESAAAEHAASGEFKQAYAFIQNIPEPSKKAELLHRLSSAAGQDGWHDEAVLLGAESYMLALRSRSAPVLREIAKSASVSQENGFVVFALTHEKVLRWAAQANALEAKHAVVNLPEALAAENSGDLRSLAGTLLEAAAEWSYALQLIRGLREWHAEAPW